jgi:hypothetical protein
MHERQGAGRTEASRPAAEAEEVRARLGSGAPLDGAVRSRFERSFGAPLGGVRVHADATGAAEASRAGARAVTVGEHVAFAPGWYRPGTLPGDALLAHELAHTVQQRRGSASGGYAALEGQADDAAAGALAGEHVRVQGAAGLRLQRCNGDDKPPAGTPAPPAATPGKAPPAGSPGTTPAPSPPAPAAPPTHSVANVRSMAIESLETNVRGSFWKAVGKKHDQREKLISDLLGLVKSGSDEETMLKKMQGRFAGVATARADATFDPAVGSVPFRPRVDAELTDDETDAASSTLAGAKFKFLRGAVKEYRDALKLWMGRRDTLDEERTEFRRFDDVFVGATTSADPAVQAAAASAASMLTALATRGISAADVKALIGVETGDLTNLTIAGITGKTRGITTNVSSSGTDVVGLAQIKSGARGEAIAWAAAAGVTITTAPDPRLDALMSILLAMGYLGHTADYLKKNLPKPLPAAAELRKMVFAAYNGGPPSVVSAAKAHGKTPYTWDDIKTGKTVSGEMRSYVVKVDERLAP